jgi:hypothetical protein
MRRYTLPGALAALLVSTAACNSDTTEPRQLTEAALMSADVAVAAGNGITEDVTLLMVNEAALPSTTASAAVAPSFDWSAAGTCTYDSGSGRFQCPQLTDGGLTLTRSYALFDGANQPQASYDAATTASANFRAAVSGTVQRPDWTATISRERDLTVSGLAGAETRRTWNGTAQSTLTGASYGAAGGAQRAYDLQETGTLTDVVVALPRADHPWPLSGTASRHFTGTMTRDGAQTVSRSVDRTVTVTFNGTSIVPLDVGDRHFWLSLSTGQLTVR